MAFRRVDRVTQSVHRELDQLIRLEIKDPNVGAVSITNVQMTRDLRRATVSVTPLGGGGDGAKTLEALNRAAGWLRGEVGRRLRLRNAPELRFQLDEHIDEAIRMTSLLASMEREREVRERVEGGEE